MQLGDFLGQVGGPIAGACGAIGGLGAGFVALKEDCGNTLSSDCIYPSWPATVFIDMEPAAALAAGSTIGAVIGIFAALVIAAFKS